MNAITKIVLATPMPKLASVKPVGALRVRVEWAAGNRRGRVEIVDLAPLINSLKFYNPLRGNQRLFKSIHLTLNGRAVAWGKDDIDMSATSIERLAEESFSSDDFRAFLKTHNLTHAGAAIVLGRSRRQIENYLGGHGLIPRVVVLACHGFAARQEMNIQNVTLASDIMTSTRSTKRFNKVSGTTDDDVQVFGNDEPALTSAT